MLPWEGSLNWNGAILSDNVTLDNSYLDTSDIYE